MRLLKLILAVVFWIVVVNGVYHVYKPLPDGVNSSNAPLHVTDVRFLADTSYENSQRQRVLKQEIFDAVLKMVTEAEQFILLDMFLFNDFQGLVQENHRALSSELTQALIRQKQAHPAMEIHVISDPLNTVYGGQPSEHFNALNEAGIQVVLTDLTKLRDSNPLYSAFWRPFIQRCGNEPADTLPNPFGEGRVSLRSYLALLNFKANHRKLIIADQPSVSGERDLAALVTSANPHDGSSAHGNVAMQFSGAPVYDLLKSELAVMAFSGAQLPSYTPTLSAGDHKSDTTLQVVTERAVEEALLNIINGSEQSEFIDVAVFYLSDRHVVRALKNAAQRGVSIRVLLDPNKDAFGREKNGIPNRPVAYELVQAGIEVRWCNTQGEQCHAKWLMHTKPNGEAAMLLGSTNFTRRNMHNFNLETSVVLRGDNSLQALQDAQAWFDAQWSNTNGGIYSLDYEEYSTPNSWKRTYLQALYFFQETTGLGTF